jgi:chitodextrinase
MPTPCTSHRRKKSPNRRKRILFVVSALLVGIVICVAGVAAAGHHRGRTPIGDSASDLLFGVARAAELTDTSAPSRPKRVALTNATQTSVTVSWRGSYDKVGVAGYEVYLFGRPTMRTTGTTYTIESLACGTTYRVGVAAYDASGNESRSSWISVSTAACAPPPPPPPLSPTPPPSDTQPPSTPSNLRVTSSTATSIGLTWTASIDNVGVAGYDVYLNGVKVWMPNGTSFTYLGLSCATTYTTAVDAYDAAGNHSPTTAITVATPACPDTTPPSTPTGLAASSVTQTSLTLTWNASTDNVGTTGYDIFRNGTKTASSSSTSSGQTGLACGTLYGFGVEAYDAAGNRSPRAQLNATTSACSAPQPPAPPPPPPPPPPSDAYFLTDFATADFRAPWTTLFSYSTPGWVDLTSPATQTADGRVKVVANPAGTGNVARFEIRDSDPAWPGFPYQKSELRTVTDKTFNRAGGAVVGDVRWFSNRIYMPYTATEKFEWPTVGSDKFFDIMDLHPGCSTCWPAISLEWYPGNPVWAHFRVFGGNYASPPAVWNVNLWQITDASGNRVMANHNRWIDLVWGVRFAPDSSGWFEVWVDGVNVLPRTNHATMWSGDSGMYLKQGLYKNKSSTFPSGASVIYFGPTRISYSKP